MDTSKRIRVGEYRRRQGKFGDRLRMSLRYERERRGWTQVMLAEIVSRNGLTCHTSTIAKIESGARAVRPEELFAFSEIFNMSADVLMGRNRGSDLPRAANSLASSAQKMAGETERLKARLRSEYDDVREVMGVGGDAIDNLLQVTEAAILALDDAHRALNRTANQFPIPT